LVGRIKETLGGAGVPRFKTIECSIMDVADDIAYSTYDLEDAFDARFLTPLSILGTDDTVKEKIAHRIQGKINIEFSDLSSSERQFSIDDMNAGIQQVFSTILGIDGTVVFGRKWGTVDLATYVGSEVFRASDLLARSKYHIECFL
jgi:dGTPase